MSNKINADHPAPKAEDASKPDPDFQPGAVPAIVADPKPNRGPDEAADPSARDVSGDAPAAAVPVHGFVNHYIKSTDGTPFPVHTPGLVLIENHGPDDTKP